MGERRHRFKRVEHADRRDGGCNAGGRDGGGKASRPLDPSARECARVVSQVHNSGVYQAAVKAERPARGDDGRATRLGACGVRELRQSVAAAGCGQQHRGHVCGHACTGVAVRAGQAKAAVPGRTEAVTAPGGGKHVVYAF